MNDRFNFRVFSKNINGYIIGTMLVGDGGKMLYDVAYESCNTIQGDYIIEQYTGLKDKNGNLIYEGDLIKSPNNSHKLVVIRMENGVYGCKECRFNGVWEMNLYDLIKHYGVEIIGNIHEQKEQQ